MHSHARALLAVALVAGVIQGCELKSDGVASGGSGGIGGTGFGGTGFGGGGGTGGFFATDAGTAGGGGSFVVCQLAVCRPPMNLGAATGLLSPCCTDEGRCGLGGLFLDRCLPLAAATRNDATCPTATLVGMPVTGCCTPQSACGVNLDQVSLGCVARRDVAANGFFDFGGLAVDIACFGGGVDAGDGDAGADDAGDPICEWARTNFCDPLASCHVEGGAPVCVCPSGYADLSHMAQPGTICRDINECLLGASVCDGGTCVNTVGSFVCE